MTDSLLETDAAAARMPVGPERRRAGGAVFEQLLGARTMAFSAIVATVTTLDVGVILMTGETEVLRVPRTFGIIWLHGSCTRGGSHGW